MLRTGTPDWAEIIRAYVAEGTSELGVAIPGNVVSYADGLASVRPGVRKLVPDEDNPDYDYPETAPVIPSVPVVWPRGRNFQIVGTLGSGDPVLLVCADFDISAWMRSGALSDPEDAREHSWGHGAVAIPGLVPDSGWSASAPTKNVALAEKIDVFANYIAQIPQTTTPAEVLAAVNIIIASFNLAMNAAPLPGGIVLPAPSSATVGTEIIKTDS